MDYTKKDIRDIEIMQQCESCCLGCEKYKTAKEQNKNCEVRKARGRVTNRQIYKTRKENKLKEKS